MIEGLLSIVIPCKNEEKQIGHTLATCRSEYILFLDADIEMGEFNEKMVLGDNWDLTHKIPRHKFGVAKTFIWTTNRRFTRQGHLKTFSRYFRVAFSKDFRDKGNKSYMDVKF